ncbi:MAG: sugar nucleotide-binding protein, partial [Candidatus Dadabacteria bacterium]|nr:sugar nucleotide-binding protein [Candidatus Dadabacteria bacterium]
MLGHDLLVAYSDRHDVKVTLRNNLKEYDRYNLFTRENSFDGIDIRSTDNVKSVLKKFSPDVVINATGIVKQRDEASSFIPSIEINALFPHKLNVICGESGSRLIHMSTDCVFSGKKGNYTEDDFADADDLYGRSKFLGEVTSDNCITIRSSIIGLELQHKKSLIEWFLSQKGEIRGFRKAIYTGLTTMEMARVIERILLEYTGLNGIYHIA